MRDLTQQCVRLWAVIGGLMLTLLGGAAWFAISSDRKATALDHLPEIAVQENSDLVYDASQLQPGQTRLFTYPVNSSERERLLITRDSKGTTRAAFATCPACYRFRTQHYLREGNLICAQCQQTMRVGEPGERLTPGKSCVAVPVPFSIENNKVVVRAQAITDGVKAFISVAKLAKSVESSNAVTEPSESR